jgi:hypothetical protein
MASITIQTTQLFSKRGLGYLWDNRSSIDPGQEAIINTIYNNRKKKTLEGQQTITYKLSNKGPGKLGWGRLYGDKGSLETLEKECRGTLCEEYYHDLDIVNCHFVILSQFAKSKFNKDMPEVDKYIHDREAFFRMIDGNRDAAKQEVIRILYGGIPKNDCLIPLSQETKKFSKFLSMCDGYTELFEECKKKDNVYGSFLSFVLQTEERKCMLAMKSALEELGWSVDVLAYDGVMVRKNDKLNLEIAIRKIETVIKDTCQYELTIVNKPMSSFKLPELKEEIVKGVSREMYDEMKSRFEENNFYYIPSNEMIQVNGRNLMRMTLEHAREYYSRDWRFKHSDKFEDYTTFFDIWRKDANRRTITKIDMKESTDPSVFVMPPKFAWQEEGPIAEEAVAKFCEIMELIGTEEQQRYFIRWLAQLVQRPFEPCGTSIVITGDKRTGKDTPMDFFREFVMGLDYSRNYTCSGSQFFDKYDTGRMNMFFCKVEEANRKIFMANADKFKALITSSDEMFNDKGKRAVVVANYNRFVLTTNGACPVELSDGEQRFMVATCSSARKHDTVYWAEVRKILFNKEAGRAVGKWLSELPIDDFNFRIVPADSFQTTIVEAEKTSEELFLEDWDGQELDATALYQKYRTYCQLNELPYKTNAQSYGIANLKLLRNGKLLKKKTRNSAVYYKNQE